MSNIWTSLFINPILNALVAIYHITGNLGTSIIILTIIVRIILMPTTFSVLKNAKKQRALQPEIDAIKKKYKHDRRKQAEAQMELFKKHGISTSSGCLSQIVMLVVIIALFRVIRIITGDAPIASINSALYFPGLKFSAETAINTKFLYMDLAKPDPYYVLAVLSGVLQFIATKMTMPFIKKAEKVAKDTPAKTDDIAFMMQQQTLYIMPIINVMIGVTLPAGVVLYLVITSAFTVAQNYFTKDMRNSKKDPKGVKKDKNANRNKKD